MTTKCIICGQPVTPDDGIVLGALGRPLALRGRAIVYHRGDCARIVHEAISVFGKGALGLLKLRAPKVMRFVRDAFSAALKGA